MRAGWITVGLFVASFGVACVAGDQTTSQPGDKPVVKATSRPAKYVPPGEETGLRQAGSPPASESTTLSSGDPKVDGILDRLEVKGQSIKGLGCKVTYKYVTVFPVEDAQIKEGELLFARTEPNSRFLIHFTKMIADGIVSRRGEYFLFDGEWLTERNDKARTIIKRQIVRKGERVDPFKLGKGPFPLPFGQKRADILRNFKVRLKKFALGDPRNTHHLHCVPLPNTELARKYSRVDIFVSGKIELPVRIMTERLSDGNRIEVDFKEIDTDEAPALSRFQIEEPDNFTVTEEPLPVVPKGDG